MLAGWRRRRASGPIDVLAGGPTVGEPSGSGDVLLTLPPGARGTLLPSGELVTSLADTPCWVRIAAVADGLLTDRPAHLPEQVSPTLEDCLLGVWQGPFAWFLLAEPEHPDRVAALAVQVAAQLRDAQTRGSSPEHALRASRLEKRHRELREAESTGLWRVHLLAGGETPGAARSIAGLVAASADLEGQPYALVPLTEARDIESTLSTATGGPGAESPFLAGSALVAAIVGTPAVEIPGVRLALRADFDVTPETDGTAGASGTPPLTLGEVLDRNGRGTGPFVVSPASLNRHTFVCGATGAGKSQTIRHLLEEATGVGLPWLVIEPAKAEYHLMANRIGAGEVVRIRPGDPASVPVGLNPLEPAPGFALQTHLDLVRALFLAAFEADEPFPQVLSAALTRCYEDLGWNLAMSRPRHAARQPRYPTLEDLQRTVEEVVTGIGYGREVSDNVRGFMRVRISSLRLGTPGWFFERAHPLDLGALLDRNVVIEIEDVGDDRDKAFLMGIVLIRLVEHLRVRQRGEQEQVAGGLRHLTVVEEAHRLLRRTDQRAPAAHSVELFAAILAAIRAYGEGLVVAEQIPGKLVPDVIKNTAVKIVHRLPAQDDRDAVGATMNLTETQSQHVVTLPPGTGAVFRDGMDFPILVRMPDGTSRERGSPTLSSPAVVLARPHGCCGPGCAERPCTVAEIDEAQQLLVAEPRLVVWAELSVVAHLIGMPMPVPREELATWLRSLETRLRDAALGAAVRDAVASRSAPLAASHDPAVFGAHVTADLRAFFTGRTTCDAEPWPWLAAPYRWSPVLRALQQRLHQGTELSSRHPDSEHWQRAHGEQVPGADLPSQLAWVRWKSRRDRSDSDVVQQMLLGRETRSSLERALTTDRSSGRWGSSLQKTSDFLSVAYGWPPAFLATSPKNDRTEESGRA